MAITIRWDKSYFNLGSIKPADVNLYYTATGAPAAIKLLLCTAAGPSPGIPCLDGSPKLLKNTDTPVKDLWGDLQFNVNAKDNGKYTVN